MTDDDRLAALFRAAASDDAAPRPGFDHSDVVTASRRITARRRSAMVGGTVALFAVLGIGAAVVLPGSSDEPLTTASAPAEAQDSAAAPGAGAASLPDLRLAAPSFAGTPLGPGTSGCVDRQDDALRAYVEQALPEAAGAPEAAITTVCRPGGARGVNVEVSDAGVPGLLSVEYLPPGEQGGPQAAQARTASAPTASGGTVTVSVRPAKPGAAVPFETRLDAVAAFLAPRL